MKHITAKDNPFIKHINKLIKSSKYRRECGEFVAEGVRLCDDALRSGAEISAVVASEFALKKYSEELEALVENASDAYSVSNQLFASFSDTKSPQGILCVIKTLDKHSLFDKIKCNGKFIALDNVQDPSNLGTILRTAEAVGIDGVILSHDCCDIYSPKVVRGSMGAVFRLPSMITDTISGFLKSHTELFSFAAVVDSNADSIVRTAFPKSCVVCVGNEGNGLKPETVEACCKAITIPMIGRAESLNAAVAAGIIMWEMMR